MPHTTPALSSSHQRKTIAAWLLTVFLAGILLPLPIALTPLPAVAGCGPGGCSPDGGSNGDRSSGAGGEARGLLSGLGESFQNNPLIMVLLVTLLTQLFQKLFQGGSTPQRGSAEEQPARPPSDPAARFGSGPLSDPGRTQGSPLPRSSTSPSPLTNPVLFLVSGQVFPESLVLQPNDAVTVINTENNTRTVTIRPQRPEQRPVEEEIEAGQSHVFRLPTAGVYIVCTVQGEEAEQCSSSIEVVI